MEGRDSPKTERSDKTETGYFSASLPSTPNQLGSLDDMISSANSPTFGGMNFSENETFKQSHVLKLFSDGNAQDSARSRSDPITSTLASGQTSIVQTASERTMDTKWTCNSEPNLVARDLTTLAEVKRAISTQEVQEVKEAAKIEHSRKGSTESTDSLRSPTGSPFDQHGFPQQRSDSQKSFSSNASVPDSPVASGPKPKQKPVSCDYDIVAIPLSALYLRFHLAMCIHDGSLH